ncbi:MAG TPA: SUMF1/EgtB/PvdO family nonheme iron enzyme [Candidatus Limnocylindrales bacterium]|nr:SUMF1/EgtB/PvdO family nonheme iron enzyme [Candidatus Limnocylindrales bacterium]
MKLKTFFVWLCLAMLAPLAATAQPVVSNVRVAQRAGTQLVDVYYDLASASNALTVSVAVSTNGGASYTLPATSFTGAVGNGIAPGTNQKITWNAGQDWPTNFSANVRFRVTADDQVAPSGMALIPAGSFTMGDSLNDWPTNSGPSNELPLHTVYVSAFYMDKYDVTLALWQPVYNWATNHGYNFDNVGSGKAANHPAQSMTWYDAVKWCNARSQMEGRLPAYYTSAAQTTVYRTGQVDVDNSWVKWNVGYRLPTEAEWEKAARGGLSGQRFPWGNTISWSQANFYAYPQMNYNTDPPGYAYDLDPTNGYNPAFNDGVYPFTSPVGYFAPNGYGLYDMAGNVLQWCWDCWGYYSSGSQTDPHGAASGSYHVLRGGCYGDYAIICRAAFRNSFIPYPTGGSYVIGFRSVLPHPDQPTITVQPSDRKVYPGRTATFSVTATGGAPLYYQWQNNGVNFPAATGASLTLTNVQLGIYYISVEVSNGVGFITSRSAQLVAYSGGIGEL